MNDFNIYIQRTNLFTVAGDAYTSIPFLVELCESSLEHAVLTFENASAAAKTPGFSDGTWTNLFRALHFTQSVMVSQPLEDCTLQRIQSTWPMVETMRSRTYVHDANALLLHASIMIAHYNLHRWISRCLDHILDHSQTRTVFFSLLQAVQAATSSRLQLNTRFEFSSKDYLPQLHPPRTFQWLYVPARRGVSLCDTQYTLCSAIFFCWLGVPTDEKHIIQTHFLNHLMDSCQKEAVLFLDPVWRAYESPKLLKSTRTNANRLPSGSEMLRFADAAKVHPICGLRISEAAQGKFQDIESLREQFLTANDVPPPPPLLIASPIGPPSHSCTTHGSSSSSQTSLSHALSDPSHMIQYRSWLIELAAVIGIPRSADNQTSQQKRMLKDMDRNCPFRELGTSRQIFCAHPITTPAAIFSVLVFRGILFKTEALVDHDESGFFHTYEAWCDFVATYPKDPTHRLQLDQDPKQKLRYFCHPGPYGRTNKRTYHNAQRFWDSSQQLHNKLNEPGWSFTAIVRFISSAKTKGVRLFPSFGELSAFLLAADLVYAGRIAMPTVEEVGRMVFRLKKGALHGLVVLGLIPDQEASEQAVAEAFTKTYSFLDNNPRFSVIKAQVGFDVFVVEHSLCKLARDHILD